MRFNISATAILALATSVFAQTADFDPVNKPDKNEVIPAGSTYNIEWTAPAKYSSGTVKIALIGGATQDTQDTIMDVASGVQNSAESYSWAVDASLGDKAIYGLVITLEGTETFQYSKPFHIKAAEGGDSTGSATTTLTKSHGVKTVSLESTSTPCPTTTSEAPVTTSTVVVNTTTVAQDTTTLMTEVTTIAAPTTVESTTVAVVTTSDAPATTTSAVSVPDNAAGHVGAGSVAFIGGLAMAVLAL